MNLQNLLENAHLDALGLLDEQELAAFNAAFAAAPPQVQLHIRQEQARWANLDFLLPRIEPPDDLRARVLAAVGEAMLASEAVENDTMSLRPSKRVARHWRTAAVCMFAATLVLGAAFINVRQLNEGMRVGMSNSEVQKDVLKFLGGTEMNDTLFSAATQRVQFVALRADFGGGLPAREPPLGCRTLRLQTPGLDRRSYHVAVLDEDGQVSDRIASLGAGGKGLVFADLPAAAIRAGARLALVSIADGASSATILMAARV